VSEPLLVRVVPDVKGMERELDYLVPEALGDQVRVGTLVRIPLGPRRERAWVVAVGVTPPEGVTLRAITKVTGHGPPASLVELARWAAWRWAGRWAHLLVTASPPGAVPALPPTPAHPPAVPQPRHPLAEEALARGGGIVRVPPADDRLGVVLAAIARGHALVLAPSADEARLLALRLRRAGLPVALHPRDWALGGAGCTVVGTQAAAWAPVGDLAAVVVLDEHDEALRHESAPTWSARDVALERARRAGVPCLFVSPVPSLDALAWAEANRRPVLTPSRNDERAGWPLLQVIDRSREEPWAWGPVTPALLRHLRDPDQHVVCVLNSPGRARRLACRTCRSTTRCEPCGAAVAQTAAGVLQCPRCATERPVVCQVCGSSALVPVRPGLTRLRDQLEAAAERPVVEVTGASAASEPIPAAGIHLGTEAVLHRVDAADVVAFLDIDAELLAPRFRAAEQALGLLARAARLVGGRAGGGRLLVQTRLPHHEVLDAVLHADPGRLVPGELERRRALGFPPATALAVVDGAEAGTTVDELRTQPAVSVTGPSAGRWLVRAPTWEALADALAAVSRPPGKVRVEVDPRRL
jgi:primosomal protein N' (replication factor Y)